MTNIQMKSSAPFTKQTLASINKIKVQPALNLKEIRNLNVRHNETLTNPDISSPTDIKTVANISNSSHIQSLPPLLHTTKKGQKVQLFTGTPVSKIKACLGWNVSETECDIDVSAFMLNQTGKVPGDDWFVFYGQNTSPDGSVVFNDNEKTDRESITVDFLKLNPTISKIVFVLTINEAFEKKLNFSMAKDAYIRILNASNNSELVSFKMDEYYSNVTSMMIGEIYIHNGNWKFNAIGNGVYKDLAGLCELYGVQII